MADGEASFQNLSALLNGIARKNYYDDAEITDTILKKELYPSMSDEEYAKLSEKCTHIIKSMATSDMDFNQLDAFLTSQTKRRGDSSLTEDQTKVFVKFWKNHRSRIHDSLVHRVQWNRSIKDLKWRIDAKTKEGNAPEVLVELCLSSSVDNSQDNDTVKFKLNERELQGIIANLKQVEGLISTCKH